MPDAPAAPTTPAPDRLLRINEVASETGLTTRAIRYYEEIGLLEPAARSEGDYRLYDASDLDRLAFIRSLRDDAGFSLAQIGQLLEDEAARERNRERYRATEDPAERRAILTDARVRVDRQIETLEAKAVRLATMIDEARARRVHLDAHLAELDGGDPPHPDRPAPATRGRVRP
jgi:DNA-binding transcriptional MerR regulator